MRKKVVIMGAAGRDFHNFNMVFRQDEGYEVVGFTAAQIPNIAGRTYPPELAGPLYPDGIPVYSEVELTDLIRQRGVDLVVFAYSDVSYDYLMHRGSMALSCGADFLLLGPKQTQLKAKKPVIAVGAVRTGCGKSPTTRKVASLLKEMGLSPVIIRHPMPYGDLRAQICQRFASLEDLSRHQVTIEEREEFESHIEAGFVVFAGVDYSLILKEAEKEASILLWDGGNNDFPFYQPDLFIVIADPHRAGDELRSHPGETNLRMANVVILNKMDSAPEEGIKTVRENIQRVNPNALVIEADMPISVDQPEWIQGKRVLVIEDGPTLTHGLMPFGAGYLAAVKFGAKEIIDPRKFAIGSIQKTFIQYPHIGPILPAMGYSETQREEMSEVIQNAECESVVVATPANLSRLMPFSCPSVRVTYTLQERGPLTLRSILKDFIRTHQLE